MSQPLKSAESAKSFDTTVCPPRVGGGGISHECREESKNSGNATNIKTLLKSANMFQRLIKSPERGREVNVMCWCTCSVYDTVLGVGGGAVKQTVGGLVLTPAPASQPCSCSPVLSLTSHHVLLKPFLPHRRSNPPVPDTPITPSVKTRP